ncbi:MAG TPA: DUF2231 domain-containing protein [Blastocatellia bacterium]|nr:DUF2231 domain-containing protein [Blastocatellia bacterium]
MTALGGLNFGAMITDVPIRGRRNSLRVIGVYFAGGGLGGLAFCYITRVPALEEIFFQRSEKFSIPTYWYWAMLGVSLLAAIVTGWAIARLAGWQNRRQISWFRYVVASILVAGSVPFQVWLFEPRHQLNEDFSFWDSNDLYFVSGTCAIAIIAYLIGLLTKARWVPRLPMSLFLIVVLAVLPTGVFAVFIALAAYAVTRRFQITFALAVMLAIIGGVVAEGIVSRIVGSSSIWPLAEASASAVFGYQIHRTTHGSFGLLLRRTFLERISENAD